MDKPFGFGERVIAFRSYFRLTDEFPHSCVALQPADSTFGKGYYIIHNCFRKAHGHWEELPEHHKQTFPCHRGSCPVQPDPVLPIPKPSKPRIRVRE